MMMLVRTHYVIDMIAGFFIAHYMHIMAERVSYFFDVKVLGVPGKKRYRNFYKPCKCCGWSNKCATDYMGEEERARLKALHKEHLENVNIVKALHDSDEEDHGSKHDSKKEQLKPGKFTKL